MSVVASVTSTAPASTRAPSATVDRLHPAGTLAATRTSVASTYPVARAVSAGAPRWHAASAEKD